MVAAGSYAESVTLSGGVSLLGAGAAAVTIQPPAGAVEDASWENDFGAGIEADVEEGLSLDAERDACGSYDASDDASVADDESCVPAMPSA